MKAKRTINVKKKSRSVEAETDKIPTQMSPRRRNMFVCLHQPSVQVFPSPV